jgi:hypothetical protein
MKGLCFFIPINNLAPRPDQWNKVSYTALFPEVKPSDTIVTYFWHLGKREFYIDDLKIERVDPKTNER